MAILVDKDTRVVVQGITGPFGSFVTRNMIDAGTRLVGGVAQGRRSERVWGVPVYGSVREVAAAHGPIGASVVLVPGADARKAVVEALDSGVGTILVHVERVPIHDAVEMISLAARAGARLIGPGSAGLISPGKGSLGVFGSPEELARLAFVPGRIGVISRSGGQTTTLCWNVCNAELGISTAVNLGSEPILGMTFSELLPLFEADPETDAVACFGEIGTVMEEEAAEVLRNGGFRKPLVAYIAGRGLAKGIRFSHASAIIEGGRGTAEGKIKALREGGARVVERPDEIGSVLQQLLRERGSSART